eukprot:3718677-Pleurochrysis_carterae.AAC.1
MLPHISANLRHGALESCPPVRGTKRRSVNGRDAGIGHQELLRECKLVANPLLDMVSRGNHVVLIGVVVQAVEESVKHWRVELSASRCPGHG